MNRKVLLIKKEFYIALTKLAPPQLLLPLSLPHDPPSNMDVPPTPTPSPYDE